MGDFPKPDEVQEVTIEISDVDPKRWEEFKADMAAMRRKFSGFKITMKSIANKKKDPNAAAGW